MFATADLMIVNKIDLLPHLSFDLPRLIEGARQVKPGLEVIELSSTTGAGPRPLVRLAPRSPAVVSFRLRVRKPAMCLALPARITEIHDGDSATVTLGGVRKQVSLALVEDAEVGDYVIVHVGYALSKLDPDEAERTLALLTIAGRRCGGMKYVDEYRDGAMASRIAAAIAAEADPARRYSIMEFCGGHTHAICRYGIEDLLPANVDMIHGPGCPVCVLPIGRLDMAIELARRPEVILCAYGDMMRVPGSDRTSLTKARAQGADIRMVYGSADALRLAQENPDREVVFFAIGFETTTPTSAVAIKQAAALGTPQLQRLRQPRPDAVGDSDTSWTARKSRRPAPSAIDGFIGPAMSARSSAPRPYERFARDYRRPIAVSGFEPLDIMQAILMLVRQVNEGRCEVENQFSRAVTRDGNAKAQALVDEVFELRDSFEWRGLGTIPDSALQIREAFADWDAERRWQLRYTPVADNKACSCGEILRGAKKPLDCKIFGTVCTPENPMGSCMVSPEGSCAAYYLYGRWRDA